MDIDLTRRSFLAQATASVGDVLSWVRSPPSCWPRPTLMPRPPPRLQAPPCRFFTPQQAADFDAFAAQIIPTDDTPGAREANVVHFTDYAAQHVRAASKQPATPETLSKRSRSRRAKTVPGRRHSPR